MNNLRCSKSLKESGFALQLATGRKAGRLARISRAKRRGFTDLHTSFRYLNSNPVRSFASILALLLSNVSSRFWTGFGGRLCRIPRFKSGPDFFSLSLSPSLFYETPPSTTKLRETCNSLPPLLTSRRCKGKNEKKRDEGENIPRAKIFLLAYEKFQLVSGNINVIRGFHKNFSFIP